jgi:hypothetical protein
MSTLRYTILFSVYLMPTTMLQANDPSNSCETQQRTAADIGSTHAPIESWVYSSFDRLAANPQIRPEWQLNLEDQTECWRFALLSATPKREEFTILLSCGPVGRAK